MSIRRLPGGRWEWRHRVDGRHLKRTFDRRADAVAHDAKVRADHARGVHVDATNKTTVAEYFARWVDGRAIRPGTRLMYQTLLHTHLAPLPLGSRPLVKVKPSEVQAWARDRAAVVGPHTLRRSVGVLRSAFATAMLDGLIARNPVQPITRMSLPKADKRKVVPLTVEQVQAWAAAADPRIRPMILAQAGLGLRIGELKALRLADVDFLRREVHITEQADVRTGQRAPLKTPNGRRVVPLPQVTAQVLAEHVRRCPPGPGGLVFTQAPEPVCKPRGRSVPGVTRTRLAPGVWSAAKLWRLYHQAAEAAGLPERTASHALRHHYASVLLAAGESVLVVADRIGDSPDMVLRVYGHVMPDREDTTRRAIDAAWADGGGQARRGLRG